MVKLKSHLIKNKAKSDVFNLNYKRRVGKKDTTQRLGSKVAHDVIHNCLTCDRWVKCHDSNKGANFRCSRFKEAVIDTNSLDELFGEFNPFDVAQNTVKEEDIFKRSGDDEDSILDMIAKVIDSNIPVPPDLRINDNSIPLAKNFYEWCMDDRFAKSGMPPFPRQIEIGIKLFNEFCPRCSDVDWFDTMPVDVPLTEIADRVVFLNNGKCPECKTTKSELVCEEELPDYFGVIGLAGQRSAKTTSVILWDSYNLHKVLKLPSPQSVFGTLATQVITSTFAATTFGQAVENVWNPYLNTLKTTPWFANYHSFLDMRGEDLGEELYTLGEHMVRYRHRNLLLSPSGPSKRTMRGRCVIGSTIVNTNQGFVSFNELIPEKFKGYREANVEVSIDSHEGVKKISHVYQDKAETIKIKTLNGYEIEGTHEHPMLTLDEQLNFVWKPLDQIVDGDWIVSKTKHNKPLFGDNKISMSEATVLGYMTANGYYDDLSSNDEKVIQRFYKAIKDMTGSYPTTIYNDTKLRAHSHHVNGGKRGGKNSFFVKYLNPLGFTAKNSREKCIPISIRTASKSIIHEYLEAYFECDSGINGDASAEVRPGFIELSSASSILVKQLHVLLLQIYGIVGRVNSFIREDVQSGKRKHWVLRLTGYDAALFLQTFKRAKVQKYRDRFWDTKPGIGSDRRIVPFIRTFLWDLYESRRNQDGIVRGRKIQLDNGKWVLNSIKPKMFDGLRSSGRKLDSECSEEIFYQDNWKTLLPFLYNLNPKAAFKVEALLNLEAHFEKVVKVKIGSKIKRVYDVTVPDGHCFTANGLASHNTRLCSVVDEIGWFPLAKKSGKNGEEFEKLDAKGVFTALNNSLFTLKSAYRRRTEEGYNDLPKPVMYAVSSPSQYNDFIMSSYRTYVGSTEMMAWKYKTWEYNPLLKKKDFKEEFRLKPVEAARDYECNPPIGEGLFISDHPSLIKAFRHGHNKINVISRKTLSKTKLPMTAAEVRITSNNLPSHGTILCVDVGLSDNSFAFSIVGPTDDHDPDILPEDRGTLQTPVKVYAIGEVIPKSNTRISLTSIFTDCFIPLVEPFNVKYFVSDRWQNAKIAQDLEAGYEVAPLEHKCVWEDFETTRDLLYSGNLLLPKLTEPFDEIIKTTLDNYPECFRNRPTDHLAWQFATVRENTGVTVLKGDGGTDDLFRTIVLGVAQLQDDEILEELLDVNSQQTSSPDFLSMVVKMKNGASANKSGGSAVTAVRRLRSSS